MARRSRQEVSTDITPLIDVVFLLLIFFMTSTVFKKSELALLLSLPKTESGEAVSAQTKTIVIEVNKDQTALDGKNLSPEELEAQLTDIKNKETPIDLRVDKEVQYQRLVKILDILKKLNLSNLSLITEN
ncbi:biopolymer transporter ExbD [Bacteriovorax sp. Seq25_V]|uniref:ExbD/TolR family protein n=1 Tax=Bacteriovorax sp. Seq25_V TaxID=1201288 RepID=UPI00038A2091|nr:biopolymer transporter ExbD [Bacteriovorax sp. Seq25_V]EQC45703.1 transport energizing protein, ExbD/TolR family [Bacteriovorax sp. Seq25_V]